MVEWYCVILVCSLVHCCCPCNDRWQVKLCFKMAVQAERHNEDVADDEQFGPQMVNKLEVRSTIVSRIIVMVVLLQ